MKTLLKLAAVAVLLIPAVGIVPVSILCAWAMDELFG